MRTPNFLVALVSLGCCLGASGLVPVTHVLGGGVEPSAQEITDAVQAIEAVENDLEDLDGDQAGTAPSTEQTASEIAREREILLKVVAAKNRSAERNKRALIGVSAVAGTMVLIGALLGARALYRRRNAAGSESGPVSSAPSSGGFFGWFRKKPKAEPASRR